VRALSLLLALGLLGIPPGLRGRELERLPTRKRAIALTLDAGGNAEAAWSVVTTLRRRHVQATFFLTGRWVQRYPRLARVIGHYFHVANHSFDHAHLTGLSDSGVAREVTAGGRAIRRATGRDPRPLFRFPFGDRDSRTIAIANRLGYVSVRWTVDTLGWMGAESVAAAVRRVVDALEPGAIVLMHVGAARDGSILDTLALPEVIRAVRARGYSFTTLERLREAR
jgi:peptidoglycan/xylan/chitin deacetylase (PgdA/CDA1 family)